MSDMGGRLLRVTALILFSAFLWGCDGDDGERGATGATGPAGPQGPQGPAGPSSGIPVTSAERINVTISSVTVPAGGGAPTVELTLTNDLNQGLSDLPAGNIRFIISQLTAGSGGGSSEWQAYQTRDSAGIPDAQATTETATAGTYVDNGDGTYQYTFAQALTAYPAGPTYDETKRHRVGIEIRTTFPPLTPENIPANNAPYDFVPNGGMFTESRAIVDNDTCNACHDNLELHGEARFDVDYCVTCHNPYSIDGDTVNEAWGGTVDMVEMIHKIHFGENLANGYFIFGFGGTLHDYSDVVFPQDIRNCETCHEESDANTPEASNWYEVANRTACGACHDDIDWPGGGHSGIPFFDDTQCLDCHGPTATTAGVEVRTQNAHFIDTEAASELFSYNIISVTGTAPGQTPVVRFSVTDPTNNDAPYDIHNDTEWTTCQFGLSRLAIGVNWSTTDYTNTGSGNTPANPVSMNPLTACGGMSTDEGNGEFSVTSPVAIPMGTNGSGAATMDGHPAVLIDGGAERIAVTNAIEYFTITDTTAVARRDAVAIDKCNDCHNQLAMHGNNRTDNIEVCVTCHNPNNTDINRRAGQCATDLGTDDVSVDMKYMIHALHAGGTIGVPYEVCGFGNNPHVYDFVYPGKLNNCEGCHVPGGYYPVDPTAVLATTVDVNDPSFVTDDVAITPNSAICSTCHVSDLAKTHMEQNGGSFNATKNADSSSMFSLQETCELCHGPGRSSDVGEVHDVASFRD